jgi:glutamate formiminotransferase
VNIKHQSAIGSTFGGQSAMLIECVPNFSEGRNMKVVERLIHTVESVEGAFVLDRHIDPDHNRSVITFVAEPNVVVEAAVRVVARAKELIDLSKHTGEHPRIGATDVFPFIPINGVTMDDCVAFAHEAGTRIAKELGIPVFFYEYAALKPERKNLETIRRGGLRGLKERIEKEKSWQPDVGPSRLHETAGACAVGARKFLIAYNINLKTNNIEIANRIAKTVRASNGGLPFLKAIGIELHTRGIVQVSMNLIDFEQTSIKQAFEAVKDETEKFGVEIAGSEIVGLVPKTALDETAEYFPTIENFTSQTILENRIAQMSKE